MYLQLNFTILSLIFEKLLSSAVSSAPSSVVVIEALIFGEFPRFTQAFLIRFLYLDLFTLPSSSFGQNWRQAALGLTASDSQKVCVVYKWKNIILKIASWSRFAIRSPTKISCLSLLGYLRHNRQAVNWYQ